MDTGILERGGEGEREGGREREREGGREGGRESREDYNSLSQVKIRTKPLDDKPMICHK